ncbi:MAG: hypothetical protein PWQ55_565 [Chloroflexota bacterium]|nr:hypothetical protein [Chloroflexota bacterium]
MSLIDEGINYTIWELILTGKMTFAKVGELRGVKLFIYPKEQGHNEPHLHAEYQGGNVSISLVTFEILAGNIPPKQQKLAVDWCKKNQTILEKHWDNYHEEIVA